MARLKPMIFSIHAEKSPCRNCAERRAGCHDDCPKYNEYRRMVDGFRQN